VIIEDGEGGDTSHISEKMCEQALASTTDASGSEEEESGESADTDEMDTDPDSAATPTEQPTGKAIFSSGYETQTAAESSGPETSGASNAAATAAPTTNSQHTAASGLQHIADKARSDSALTSLGAGHKVASASIPGTSAGIKEKKERFKVPSMIPRPTAISGPKKKAEEPDIIPTETYRKI
jgi:hypothetical protein